ncbi:MAG: hypothetical protein HY321_21110 [Armatimonadetes bacterium]|nr:hypothetical protein [Armatimonadota bacterium]
MRLRFDVDEETARRLIAEAVRERRTAHLQAEVVLRRALNTWPLDEGACARQCADEPEAPAQREEDSER